MENLVITKEWQAVTTSLQVAERFEKRHDNVLKNIDSLAKRYPEMFEQSKDFDSYERERRIYLISEEGSNILNTRYKYKSRQESNSLYVLKHKGIDGFYKIGVTHSLKSRVKQISTSSPLGIEVVASFKTKNAITIESLVHGTFSDFRRNGEWFELTDNQLQSAIEFIESEV